MSCIAIIARRQVECAHAAVRILLPPARAECVHTLSSLQNGLSILRDSIRALFFRVLQSAAVICVSVYVC